jgi:hypothetical protein
MELALANLLTCGTITRAAEATGISEKTLRRWLQDVPEFAGAWRQARTSIVEESIALVRRLASAAVVAP